MRTVQISDIQIGERFRKDYGDITELALSISKYGLLQPIVVDQDLNLCAGGRRLEALKSLNWIEVLVNDIQEISEVERREIELEENICRKDMDWQERAALTEEIHKLKQAKYGAKQKRQRSDLLEQPGWGLAQTAALVDKPRTVVMDDIKLAEGLRAVPELAKEKNRNQALKRLKDLEERALREEIIRREQVKTGDTPLVANFFHEDCLAALKRLPAASVHCVITDPPWAVDFTNETFDDSFANALDHMDQVFREIKRVITPDAHVYVFFATKLYHEVNTLLARYFTVNRVPLVWKKDRGGLGDWDYKYTNNYETIFYCWAGEMNAARKLNKRSDAVLDFPLPGQRIHPTEKPTGLLRYLIEQSTIEGEIVLDPYAGSASTLVAAAQTNRRFIGCEANKEMYQAASIRLLESNQVVEEV